MRINFRPIRFHRDLWQIVAAGLLLVMAILVWYFAWNRGLINADSQAGYRLVITDHKEAVQANQETTYEITLRITDTLPAETYLLVFESNGDKRQQIINNPRPGEVQKFSFPVQAQPAARGYTVAQARLYIGSAEKFENLLLQQSDIDGIIFRHRKD